MDTTYDQTKIQRKMTKALNIAKKSWLDAEMPSIWDSSQEETAKISLAILAVKIFDELGN